MEPQGFRRPARELREGRRGPFCAPTYPRQSEPPFSKELQSFQMSGLFILKCAHYGSLKYKMLSYK